MPLRYFDSSASGQFNVFVLPLVIVGIVGIIILINRKELMGEHKAGYMLNARMGLAFVFACIVSYTGVVGILESYN